MAVPPNTDRAFLREVDEGYRRDRMIGFWERWGRWMIAGFVAALVLFGGYLYWQHHVREQAGVEGERLQDAYDALQQKKPAAAAAPLAALANSRSDGYRALARFTQADLLLQKDDLRGAGAIFAAIAADGSVGKPFRDLALVRQTSAEYDTLKPQVVVERLRSLAVPGSPWFGSAGELVALAQLRQNRPDLAGALFGKIGRDETVPQTIRQRAVQMAGVLGVDAGAPDKDSTTR